MYSRFVSLVKEMKLRVRRKGVAHVGKGTLEATLFTSQGPAGAIALYASAGSNLGIVFLNEFVSVSTLDCYTYQRCSHYSRPTFLGHHDRSGHLGFP